MRRIIHAALACLLGLLVVWNVYAAQQSFTLAPGDSLHVTCMSELMGTIGHNAADLVCATLVPTATMTMTPPPTVTTGWHPPGAHDGLNVHEHGDAPPQWVLDSNQQPFTQTRESHTGYKGVLAPNDRGGKGIASYLITHILTTEMARSHGDHDYQLWVRRLDGSVLVSQGRLDFSSNPNDITAPIIERTTDTGERPIALAERTPTDGCETWYSRPGALIFDLGWTICGRYQKFDGTVLGGIGAFRTMDWLIPADRLAANDPLRQSCTVEFGLCRLSWLVNSKQYPSNGVAPIN